MELGCLQYDVGSELLTHWAFPRQDDDDLFVIVLRSLGEARADPDDGDVDVVGVGDNVVGFWTGRGRAELILAAEAGHALIIIGFSG